MIGTWLRRNLGPGLVVAALLVLVAPSAWAVGGTFVPASSRVDMAHDAKRNLLYITSGGSVLRWDLTSAGRC